MRDVAIVSVAQARNEASTDQISVELIMPVINEAVERSGLERGDIGFWCHGSCDYLTGQPFSFVAAVDAIGAWPPIIESHVEADGAFALYEAWVKIQTGEVDTAVVFGNGKSASGDTRRILALQLDPYYVAPLWPDAVSVAGLQARVLLDSATITERQMAEVVARSRRAARSNTNALVSGDHAVDALLAEPYLANPFRAHDLPPVTDGAAAVVLATGDIARHLCDRPAFILGIDHRIDTQHLGWRNLTTSLSAGAAAARAGVNRDRIDVAELHAPFSHEELVLRAAMGLDDERTQINPSGGALCANPVMAAGLIRFIEVATRLMDGTADRGLAHCTSGPALQQNLVCVMEGQ